VQNPNAQPRANERGKRGLGADLAENDPGMQELERWRKQKHKDWDEWNYKFSPRGKKARDRGDYSNIKDTDEVYSLFSQLENACLT
jgi:hypothetical protein